MLHLQLQEHVDPHEAQVVQSPLPKKLKMETQGDRDEGTWHRQWIPIEDNRRVAIQAVPDPVGKEFPRWRSTAAMIHSTAVHRMYTGDTSPKATVSASRALQEGTRRPSEMYCSPCITYAGPQASPMYVMPSRTARNVSVNSNRPNAFRSIAVVAQSTTRSASPPQVHLLFVMNLQQSPLTHRCEAHWLVLTDERLFVTQCLKCLKCRCWHRAPQLILA